MKVLVCSLLLILLACGGGAEERPDDLLPREKFTEVLMEAQLIEARINHESVIDKRTDLPTGQYYADMFAAQGITEEAFKSTFDWYVDHPAELKDVYTDVLTRLQQRVDVADSTAGVH